ncbi:hypothetical protein I317_03169 [Kwoniella heveanensis CBS 569]|nr:hypothetical protein I317_03169 [Kwoniella heveanensis CBS 569]
MLLNVPQVIQRAIHRAAVRFARDYPAIPRKRFGDLFLSPPEVDTDHAPPETTSALYVQAKLLMAKGFGYTKLRKISRGAVSLSSMQDAKLLDYREDPGDSEERRRAQRAVRHSVQRDRGAYQLEWDAIHFASHSQQTMMPKLRESFNVDELVHTAREMTPQRSQYFLLKDGAPLYRRLEPLPPHVVVLSLRNNAVPNIPLTQPVPLAAMNRMREGTTTHAYPSGLLLYLDSNILLQDAQISARMIEAMAQLEAKAIILPQVVAEMRSSNAKRKLRSFIGSQTTMVASEDLQMKRSGVDMKGDPALLTGDEMIRSEAFAHAKRSARPAGDGGHTPSKKSLWSAGDKGAVA